MNKRTVGAMLLVLTGTIVGSVMFGGQVAHAAQAVLAVFVTNDASHAVPVHEQGTPTVSVNGVVQTLATLPNNTFSVSYTTTSATPAYVGVGCVTNAPNTRWAVSSFAITNTSSTLRGQFRVSLITGVGEVEEGGPSVYANPGETVQVTFPQPYILSTPATDICLGVQTATDVWATVVGYHD